MITTHKWPVVQLLRQQLLVVKVFLLLLLLFSWRRRRRRKLFLLLFSAFASSNFFQTHSLAGKVTSDKGHRQFPLDIRITFPLFFHIQFRSFGVSNFRFWFSMPALFCSFLFSFCCCCWLSNCRSTWSNLNWFLACSFMVKIENGKI